MKIVISPRSFVSSSHPIPTGLHFVQQPKPAQGMGMSILVGLGLPLIPFALLSLESWLLPLPRIESNNSETIPWWILFPVFILCVLGHEFLHLICHPGWGLTNQSVVLVWPHKMQLGVYYEGFMQRKRWLIMRLLPLVGLTLLPTFFLLGMYLYEMSFFWQQFLVLVILVNSLGAGSDVVASVIIVRQVPKDGEIGLWNGRACWR